ncbi:MAG: HD domain-containing protein [Caldisericum sp.]
MLKVIISLSVLILIYLVYQLFKSTLTKKSPKKINTQVIYNFPKLEVNLEELAEKTWLKYDDRMYHKYVNTLQEIETSKTYQNQDIHKSETPHKDKEKLYHNFSDELLSSLWKDCVEPYLNVINEQNAFNLIKEAFIILAEKGDYPSVGIKIRQDEPSDETDAKGYSLYKNLLSQVTLKEHTAHVVRFSIDLARTNFQSLENHIPKILTIALYHDLGKIPDFKLVFNNQVHPFVSGDILSQVAKKNEIAPFWIDEAIQIVKEHHLPGEQNIYKKILREADKKARILEISTKLSGFAIKNLEDWFSPEEFLRKLAPLVNEDRFGNKWYAFSFKNIVFLRLDRLLDLLDQIRQEKQIISPEMLSEEDRDKVLIKVVQILIDKDLLILPSQHSQQQSQTKTVRKLPKSTVILRDGKSFSIHLLPIKITAFTKEEIDSMEKKKAISTLSSSIAEVKLSS